MLLLRFNFRMDQDLVPNLKGSIAIWVRLLGDPPKWPWFSSWFSFSFKTTKHKDEEFYHGGGASSASPLWSANSWAALCGLSLRIWDRLWGL